MLKIGFAMKTIHLFLGLLLIGLVACGGEQNNAASQMPDETPTSPNPTIDMLSRKIEATPNDPKLYSARARLFYENGGYDEAISDLKQAMSIDSLNPDFHHLLADVYLDYYRSYEALRTLEEAKRLFPERIPTLLKLSEFQLILKQYDDALATLEEIRGIDPLNAEMFYMAGLVFLDLDKEDQAINNFQSAVENDPDLVEAWISLGELWAEKGEEVAIFFFDNALRADSNNLQALFAKAYYLSNSLDDLEGAQAVYDKIITKAPQLEDTYFNKGLLYLDTDSTAAAMEQFTLAIQFDPAFVKAYYYRGLAKELMGDQEGALADYEQALRLTPDEFPEVEAAIMRMKKAQ
jgi:tetratricopeptide (TPR) repeat protein